MSVATAMIRALVDATERAGVSKDEFLHAAGLNEERLADTFGRFEFEEYSALHELALDMTRDDALGLHIIEHCNEAAFDLLAQVVPYAPTLRDAIGLCSQFGSLLVTGSHVELDVTPQIARLRYAFRRLSPRVDRLHAELAMAGFYRMFRVFSGPVALLHRVCFEHVAPAHRSEYRRVFDGADRFEQSFTGIEFAATALDARHLHQQPRIYSLLLEEAYSALDSLASGAGNADRIRQYLMAHPPSRIPKMEVVASALRMSARSLRRRLADEGVTYSELVRVRLKETATHVLRVPGRSVQEAARETGFADAAAFHRAFKQWTGMTPTEFQRESSPEPRSARQALPVHPGPDRRSRSPRASAPRVSGGDEPQRVFATLFGDSPERVEKLA